MKNLKICVTIAVMALSTSAIAQTIDDALRFSQNYYDGSARFSAMGGAFGALGGDFSGLSVNPAGVGVFRATEANFSVLVNSTSVKSDYVNMSSKETRTKPDFNLGFVFAQPNDGDGKFTMSLAAGYNTLNNYNFDVTSKASGLSNSRLDGIVDKVNNNPTVFDVNKLSANNKYDNYGVYDWDAVMGWDSYLYDYDNTSNRFMSVLNTNDKVGQQKLTRSKGTLGEGFFTLGGNYSNKFYFGATLGIQSVDYRRDEYYTETVNNGDLNYFNYDEFYETEGYGVNGKFGVIYKPIDGLRIGAAYHTPTWLRLTDRYDAEMYSDFATAGTDGNKTYVTRPDYRNEFDYKVTTPSKYILSAAYTFGNLGLISVDYEYVDYSTIKLKPRYNNYNGYDYSHIYDTDNQTIKDNYQGTSNIRVGAEVKLGDFAIRGGYALYGSPVKNYKDMKRQIYSAGLGYRTNNFYFDLAYKYAITKDSEYPYDDYNMLVQKAYYKYNISQFVCTVGFRF